MVNYICLRCGFSNKSKTHFLNHLNRKFPCKPKLNDITLEDVKTIYLNKNNETKSKNDKKVAQICTKMHTKLDFLHKNAPFCTSPNETDSEFVCEFCKKSFTRNSSRLRHYKSCKEKKKKDEQNEIREKEYNDLKKLVKLMNEQLEQTNKQFKSLKKEIKRKNNQIVELQKTAGIMIGTQK